MGRSVVYISGKLYLFVLLLSGQNDWMHIAYTVHVVPARILHIRYMLYQLGYCIYGTCCTSSDIAYTVHVVPDRIMQISEWVATWTIILRTWQCHMILIRTNLTYNGILRKDLNALTQFVIPNGENIWYFKCLNFDYLN